MRILVTGGAGFIGSHYVRRLLAGAYPGFADAKVVVLDKLTYAGSRENLDPVAADPRLEFVHGDICDRDLLARSMGGVDVVLHFAAETHVDRSIEGSDAFVMTNLVGTDALLRAALDAGVGRFVHVSTDEVYGSIDTGSWPEEHALEPNSPYSAAKAGSDLLARAYHRTHGLPVCITRCSNNYGPYQYPEKMLPRFITNLLDDRPVPLYGDGGNVRDWLHVDDHCRAVQLVAESGTPGEVYNIGGGTELTNRELTEHLLRVFGLDWSAVQPVADRKGHDRRYSVDHTKIVRELGYAPAVDFAEGLAATVDWYRQNRSWWEPLKRAAESPADTAGSPADTAGGAR
ncbi:dTDP-glucose 4,6-dehydratase [Saccharopolyspora sp. HNM0983]|uniref:dTDP-glucose 4,6-dehydratase n=1 Tax=Saccharopolyspora montiporae TaxID=2781240 RepID=A0A929BDI5_9PSEU|nr:dTDP-glucose 4,6-dehydratase [Saccharopolyspora sp. HNM0983]MBE9376375.1 dTDP-glucose 4,6-dehydratase [Saccharopolyspora sp. HNM0983]